MKFTITMNMPSYQGNLVHQLVVEHPSSSLEQFVGELSSNDFVIVEEFYRDGKNGSSYRQGKLALNYQHIGKIKAHIGEE